MVFRSLKIMISSVFLSFWMIIVSLLSSSSLGGKSVFVHSFLLLPQKRYVTATAADNTPAAIITCQQQLQQVSFKLQRHNLALLAELDNEKEKVAVSSKDNSKTARTWYDNFERLKEYKKENGDCLVPQNYEPDRTLGLWVSTQRQSARKNTLKPDKLARLEKIGFYWGEARGSRRTWEQNFERLKKYKAEHGDCMVKARYKKDRKLGDFVARQRALAKAGELSPERKEKLDKLGFVWGYDQFRTWEENFELLEKYKADHGDCLVPNVYDEDKVLSAWVTKQRRDFNLGTLTSEQRAKLDNIGFIWEVSNYMWERNFEILKKYKADHGDCMVPTAYEKDKTLARWVRTQRQRNISGKMTPEEREKLEKIGFDWDRRQRSWQENLEMLKKYKAVHGDYMVPTLYEEDRRLGSWVLRQRQRDVKGTMKQKERAELEKLGFFEE